MFHDCAHEQRQEVLSVFHLSLATGATIVLIHELKGAAMPRTGNEGAYRYSTSR